MFHVTRKRPEGGTVRETRVRVRDGYHPDTIHAVVGQPLRITFRRDEDSACSEHVVFPGLDRSITLPQGKDVAFELTPDTPGELEFTCGMGMLRGRLVVDPQMPA